MFYEVHKDLHETFWGTTKKCENKNSGWFYLTFETRDLAELRNFMWLSVFCFFI